MTKDITEAELLQAIQAALESEQAAPGLEPGTITRPKLQEMMNVSQVKAARLLRQMVDAGTLEPAKVTYVDPWGYRQRVKGYRYLAAGAAGASG